MTLNDIKKIAKTELFDKNTIKFFNLQFVDKTYTVNNLTYFIISEQPSYKFKRSYNVYTFDRYTLKVQGIQAGIDSEENAYKWILGSIK